MDDQNTLWYFPNMPATRYSIQPVRRLLALGHSIRHHSHRDRILDHWVLGFITGGRLALAIGDKGMILQPGDWYLLPPGIRHRGLEDDRHDVAWVEFAAAGGPNQTATALPAWGHLSQGLDPLPTHRLLHLAWLRDELDQMACRQIDAWLLQLRLLQQDEGQAEQHLATELLAYLHRHLDMPLQRQDLSQAFHYSATHLNRCYQQAFGISLMQHHSQLRMRYARDLLDDGLSVKQVAHRLGFQDLSYFHRCFKRCLGHTPRWR